MFGKFKKEVTPENTEEHQVQETGWKAKFEKELPSLFKLAEKLKTSLPSKKDSSEKKPSAKKQDREDGDIEAKRKRTQTIRIGLVLIFCLLVLTTDFKSLLPEWLNNDSNNEVAKEGGNPKGQPSSSQGGGQNQIPIDERVGETFDPSLTKKGSGTQPLARAKNTNIPDSAGGLNSLEDSISEIGNRVQDTESVDIELNLDGEFDEGAIVSGTTSVGQDTSENFDSDPFDSSDQSTDPTSKDDTVQAPKEESIASIDSNFNFNESQAVKDVSPEHTETQEEVEISDEKITEQDNMSEDESHGESEEEEVDTSIVENSTMSGADSEVEPETKTETSEQTLSMLKKLEEKAMKVQGEQDSLLSGLKVDVLDIDFTRQGRGLAYNCKGLHWACIDQMNYTICEKSKGCVAKAVYQSDRDCAKAQMDEIHQNRNVCSN